MTAQPQVVHINFAHGETTDKTFGPVWFYSLSANGPAQVIRVASGSHVVFMNDQPSSSGIAHTAGGLGTSGFPSSFDNPNQFAASGSTIASSDATSWSTGILNPGQMSQAFTVGAKGAYYFGCGFHYTTVPTATNNSMGDVLVSM